MRVMMLHSCVLQVGFACRFTGSAPNMVLAMFPTKSKLAAHSPWI